MVSLTDYNQSLIEKRYLGVAAINFRNDNPNVDSWNSFILNSMNDGWFRRIEGNSKGYGLQIQSLKITGKIPIEWPCYYVYKGKIKYLDFSNEIKFGKVWVFLDKNFNPNDLINYIDQNKCKWK